MFFWTGSRTHVDGVIKKVRFETFLSVRHQKTQKGGRRFDIRVVTGRTMELLAKDKEQAEQWVSTIKEHLGEIMAVIRVQTAYRVFKARTSRLISRATELVFLTSLALSLCLSLLLCMQATNCDASSLSDKLL